MSPPRCEGITGYWPAEGDARDAVGTSHGVADGAGFGGGRYGLAFVFNGASSVKFDTAPAAGNISAFTFSLWVNVTSYSSAWPGDDAGSYFLDRTEASAPIASLKVCYDQFCFQSRYTDGSGFGGVIGGAINISAWTHVAIVRRYGQSFELFVNGALMSSRPDSGAALDLPPFKFGRHYTNSGFVGRLDDFQIYGRALSGEQIEALAAGQACL